MTQKVYILHGLPASGKSTWANKLCVDYPNFQRVNKDDIRAMMHDSRFSRKNEFATVRVRDATIVQLLLLGFDVVVDDTNLQPYHIQTIHTMADSFGATITVFHFDVPIDTCIARDAARPEGERVGRAIIERMAAEMAAGLPDLASGINVVTISDGVLRLLQQPVIE